MSGTAWNTQTHAALFAYAVFITAYKMNSHLEDTTTTIFVYSLLKCWNKHKIPKPKF